MNSPAKRCIVIGIDGASMEMVKTLISWGHLPNIRGLMDRGVQRPMVGILSNPNYSRMDVPGHRVMARHSRLDYSRQGRAAEHLQVGHQYKILQVGVHLERGRTVGQETYP